MSAAGGFGMGHPRLELSSSRRLARRVRRAQRATWFPLAVFAAVMFVAIPVTRAGHAVGQTCRRVPVAQPPQAQLCVAHNSAAYVYWPVALIAAYLLIVVFYMHLSRSRGVGTRIRPYVLIGVVLAVAVTAASVWAAHTVITGRYDVLGWHLQGPDLYRIVAPTCAIGLALIVLAVIDRSVGLVAVAIGYLVIAVGGIDFGWRIASPSPWSFAPHLVISGSLLLLAAAGFALTQLPRPHAAAGT